MRSMLLRTLCLSMLVATGLGQTPSSRPAELEDLAELLAPIRAKYHVPALGAAVLVEGKLVALGVDGVRKFGDDTLVGRDDLWHLGSCTKAMTATLLARQVAAGKLRWSTTLGEALPELRDGMHERARAITIAQLLQHRSGLPSQPPMPQWLELFHFEGTDRQARREVAETMLKRAPDKKPGERFLYSNAGFMIAGAVLERVTDKPWQELMRTQLFMPLGMAQAGFGIPGREGRVDQPWGHRPVGRKSTPAFADNPSALGPAGTVHASLRDWAKFIALHLGSQPGTEKSPVAEPVQAGPIQAGPMLSDEMLAALHQPPVGGKYAFGWVVTKRSWAPGPIVWHNGSNTMWFCVAWLAPEAKFAVLITCNQGDAAGACDEAAAACIRRFRR